MTDTRARTGYAPVGDLQMYYEIHGAGRPLVLLHGAYMNAEHFGPLIAALAGSHQVIVPEMQNHGRTADVDRPITYEQMADDTAELISQLGLERPDVMGYSMGAGIGLQLAIRHPGALRRLVAASGSYAYEGMQPAAIEMFPSLSIDMFAGHADGGRLQAAGAEPRRLPEALREAQDPRHRPRSRGRRRTSAGSPRRRC